MVHTTDPATPQTVLSPAPRAASVARPRSSSPATAPSWCSSPAARSPRGDRRPGPVAGCRQRRRRARATSRTRTRSGRRSTPRCEQFGRLDAVVHAAQVMAYGTIEEVPREVFETVVETAVHGTAVVARVVLPVFREQGEGHLVVVNSLLGQVATPLMGSYVAAKWGQLGLVRVLQQETRDVPGISSPSSSPAGSTPRSTSRPRPGPAAPAGRRRRSTRRSGGRRSSRCWTGRGACAGGHLQPADHGRVPTGPRRLRRPGRAAAAADGDRERRRPADEGNVFASGRRATPPRGAGEASERVPDLAETCVGTLTPDRHGAGARRRSGCCTVEDGCPRSCAPPRPRGHLSKTRVAGVFPERFSVSPLSSRRAPACRCPASAGRSAPAGPRPSTSARLRAAVTALFVLDGAVFGSGPPACRTSPPGSVPVTARSASPCSACPSAHWSACASPAPGAPGSAPGR